MFESVEDLTDATAALKNAVVAIIKESETRPTKVFATYVWREIGDMYSELVPEILIEW